MARTALITGASAGIGAEFARQLAPSCETLILVARRMDRLQGLKEELRSTMPGLDVRTFECDLSHENHIDRLLKQLDEDGARIDLLVNNAGVGDHGPFAEGEWKRIRSMIAVNVTALTKLTHALLPRLRERERAAIVNVSSVASFLPLPNLAIYAATKAYVTSFSEALRAELRGTGISVTTVCPGPVDTEFRDVAARENAAPSPPPPNFFKVPVEEVVRAAIRGVAHDRARVIPGLLVAVVMTLVASIPLLFLRPLLNKR